MDDMVTTSRSKYMLFVETAAKRISRARVSASRAVNTEVLSLYWWLGEHIVSHQKHCGWGQSIVEQFSRDLKKAFPSSKFGFSARNLWDMRRFYLAYKDHPNLQQLVAEIPWGQNLLILNKIDNINERQYYLSATKAQSWTRAMLSDQINTNAYTRHGLSSKQHNFKATLPASLAEQAEQSMKDVYMLDMLGIAEPVVESEIERRMVSKIKDVILELGYGFSFIGSQYRIVTPDSEYYLDLLFYHRKLQALVALDLKRGRFKPEHAGKMNFYLNLLDEFVKEPHENPSIGMVLCGDHKRFDVEYALRGIDKPVGVAGYQLTRYVPEALKDVLPDVEQLREKILLELGLDDVKT